MAEDEVLIALECDLPEVARPEVRASMKEVGRELEAVGISLKSHVLARTGGVTASVTSVGPYLIPVAMIAIPALAKILIAWVKKPARKVRVKIGGVLMEASSVEEIERLIPRLMEFQSKARSTKRLSSASSSPPATHTRPR